MLIAIASANRNIARGNAILSCLFTTLCFCAAAYASDDHIDESVRSAERPTSDLARDKGRRPAEVMKFFGVARGAQVIEIGSGGGYYTELLSVAVGDDGRVYAHNPFLFLKFGGDDLISRYASNRLKNVALVFGSLPQLRVPDDTFDAAYLIDIYHDVSYDEASGEGISESAATMLREVLRIVKPGGIVGVVDHRSNEALNRANAASIHRIPERLLRLDFEQAGFRLIKEPALLRNPQDEGVKAWFSDPALKDATDRMVFVYQNPE